MCPQSTRSLLIAQRGSDSRPLDLERAWETWRTAAENINTLIRSAAQSAPIELAGTMAELDDLPTRTDLLAMASHQRRLGDVVRQLESDLDHAGHVAGLAALSEWRESYADMITALATLRHLNGPGARLVGR